MKLSLNSIIFQTKLRVKDVMYCDVKHTRDFIAIFIYNVYVQYVLIVYKVFRVFFEKILFLHLRSSILFYHFFFVREKRL